MDMPPRVVYDCNILLQALLSPKGPSGRCIDLVYAEKVVLFCSRIVVGELLRHAYDPRLVSRFRITEDRANLWVQNLEAVAQFVSDVPSVFQYARDPDDVHYVNLAHLVEAQYLVTRDKDLLDLESFATPEQIAYRRLCPGLQIVNPVKFLQEMETA